MDKEQVIAEAKRLGLKVRENFMDDAIENLSILAVGIVIGAVVAKLFF